VTTKILFDLEYLKSLMQKGQFPNPKDLADEIRQRYPESEVSEESLLAAFKFGVMEKSQLSEIGAFFDLTKEQFQNLIRHP